MKLYLVLSFLCLHVTAMGQMNQALKRELDSIYVLDQKYRAYMARLSNEPKLTDSLMSALAVKSNLNNALWQYQNRIDSANLIRIELIIDRVGYPGSSIVGKPTNEVAWYVIQHSPKIQRYFPLIQRAAKANELPFPFVATMNDRLLTEQHKPQLYGTQAACYPLKDTSSKDNECFIWPIDNPRAVNKRRKEAGFTTTVEENAKRLNVAYKVLTMSELKKTHNLGDSK